MDSDLPDEIKAQIGIELKQFKPPYTCCDGAHEAGFIQGFNAAYRFLSNPENAAKIPEVAKLVEANNKQVKCGFAECSECASEIKEALKPFQGSE